MRSHLEVSSLHYQSQWRSAWRGFQRLGSWSENDVEWSLPRTQAAWARCTLFALQIEVVSWFPITTPVLTDRRAPASLGAEKVPPFMGRSTITRTIAPGVPAVGGVSFAIPTHRLLIRSQTRAGGALCPPGGKPHRSGFPCHCCVQNATWKISLGFHGARLRSQPRDLHPNLSRHVASGGRASSRHAPA